MAFLAEDGTGLEGANSYIDVDFANTYHGDRGNDGWTGGASAKQKALIRATDYINQRFGVRFRGYREKKNQGLEWPRLSAFDSSDFLYSDVNRIPPPLQKATAEYALRALQLNPLAPDPALPFPDRDTTGEGTTQSAGGGGVVTGKKEKVDVIEEATQFESVGDTIAKSQQFLNKAGDVVESFYIPPLPIADMWLRDLIKGGPSRTLGRA